jgi:hypothetical protein
MPNPASTTQTKRSPPILATDPAPLRFRRFRLLRGGTLAGASFFAPCAVPAVSVLRRREGCRSHVSWSGL